MESPLKYFADVRDPRVDRTREHLLEEILLLTIAAVLSGASGWNEIEAIVHMVSAWANTNNLVLAQRRVDEKSNEITAIPKLLQALELSGTVVTIDAMGCQRSIAEQIVARKADYILAVKENQGHLLEEIQDSFRMLTAESVAEQIDCGHGRVERRTCSVIGDLTLLENPFQWSSLKGLVRIQAERFHKATGKTENETRYYITSLAPEATRLTKQFASTGASKTSSIGCSTSPSAKT